MDQWPYTSARLVTGSGLKSIISTSTLMPHLTNITVVGRLIFHPTMPLNFQAEVLNKVESKLYLPQTVQQA